MAETVPLAELKAAIRQWKDSGAQAADLYTALMADQIDFRTLGSEHAALPGQAHMTSREDASGYLRALGERMTLNQFSFEDFVVEGGSVVAIGETSWTVKATGKRIDSPMVMIWRFKDGKAVAYSEFYDTAKAAAAMS